MHSGLKGGIIGAIVGLIISLIYIWLVNQVADCRGENCLSYLLSRDIGIVLFGLIIFFIIGSFIGLIKNKTKSKNK